MTEGAEAGADESPAACRAGLVPKEPPEVPGGQRSQVRKAPVPAAPVERRGSVTKGQVRDAPRMGSVQGSGALRVAPEEKLGRAARAKAPVLAAAPPKDRRPRCEPCE